MWLTLAAAGFFGIIVLVTLLRAEKSVANGALTVVTLLAIAVAVAATIRGFEPVARVASNESSSVQPVNATMPALACIDDLAGDAVLNACEKILFGAADSTAAAVAYAAAKITQLTSFGDIAAAERNTTSELQALRRAVERDRYGLMAYVLAARDHCTASACAAFRSLGDSRQIASNMDERSMRNLVTRHALVVECAGADPDGRLSTGLPPSVPTGKHSCGIPDLRLDPASEYHDARARFSALREACGSKPQTAATVPPSRVPATARRRLRRRSADRGQAPGRRAVRSRQRRAGRRRAASHHRHRMTDLFKAVAGPLNPQHHASFISSSLRSAASRSRNSRAGSPNGWRPPRKRACRFVTSTSRG
jgi:hypothetical protein